MSHFKLDLFAYMVCLQLDVAVTILLNLWYFWHTRVMCDTGKLGYPDYARIGILNACMHVEYTL